MADPAESGASAEPAPCSPCRGSGVIVSGAGGSPHEVTCPWCEGSGRGIQGHDAQAARREPAGGEDAPAAPEVD